MNATEKWIDIDGDDGKFGAWLTLPRGGSGPGIVLLQEIFGVNEHIRTVAAQYAADGYVVLAPDLFWRDGARIELGYDDAGWAQAVKLMNATDVAKAIGDIGHTVRTLRALPEVTGRVASLGFCFGGRLSYLSTARGLVDVGVAYYGGGIHKQLATDGKIDRPLLMHFGAADSHIPADAVRQIADHFDANEQVEIHVYENAEHGFNCNHRASYQQRASVQAHGHTLVFLGEQL